MKLWRNGFSIDDGELRQYTEEENRQFLDSIKRGYTHALTKHSKTMQNKSSIVRFIIVVCQITEKFPKS